MMECSDVFADHQALLKSFGALDVTRYANRPKPNNILEHSMAQVQNDLLADINRVVATQIQIIPEMLQEQADAAIKADISDKIDFLTAPLNNIENSDNGLGIDLSGRNSTLRFDVHSIKRNFRDIYGVDERKGAI